MEPEKLPKETGSEETQSPSQKKEPYEPYSRKTRLLAWIGVVFMVILVIMYTYSVATGKIMAW